MPCFMLCWSCCDVMGVQPMTSFDNAARSPTKLRASLAVKVVLRLQQAATLSCDRLSLLRAVAVLNRVPGSQLLQRTCDEPTALHPGDRFRQSNGTKELRIACSCRMLFSYERLWLQRGTD